MSKEKTVRLRIPYQDDREKMVSALVRSGYKVWIEEEETRLRHIEYFVCLEEKDETK